jgi:hypothetical protein
MSSSCKQVFSFVRGVQFAKPNAPQHDCEAVPAYDIWRQGEILRGTSESLQYDPISGS